MTGELNTLEKLAASVSRRRYLGIGCVTVALFLIGVAMLPTSWWWPWRLLMSAAIPAVTLALMHRVRPVTPTTANDYAEHLDALFPELEDSTSLLLDASDLNVLKQLQREKTRRVFASLEQDGHLERTLPPPPWKHFGVAGALVAVTALVSALWRLEPTVAPDTSADVPNIVSSQVRLTPPAYTSIAPSVSDRLSFSTFEGSDVQWDVTLDDDADDVQLHFHDGEVVPLESAGRQRWQSNVWPARSSVYRVMANGSDVRNGVFRIDAEPDLAPNIVVTQPEDTVRIIPGGTHDSLTFNLDFAVDDDFGVTDVRARFTLARGSGEQVRFREAAIEVEPHWSNGQRSATVNHTLDLLELGMEAGDEVYLFAEAVDNRVPAPNVSTSQTYIVRWPAPDDRAVVAQATLAVPVVPEFFRSQRQLIIDTEKLLEQRPDLDEDEFRQRAQLLAIDQKLLRLRYGQYLGEEEDSGIGVSTQRSLEEVQNSGKDTEQNTAGNDHRHEHDHLHDHDALRMSSRRFAPGDNAQDLRARPNREPEPVTVSNVDSHDHAAHAAELPSIDASSDTGNAEAVIALNAHMHDREEQATLFEPETRELLRRALAQMWDAELQLRLVNPDAALPFEYAALKFIKEVQQSDRVYLRRTGFQPTPIDEDRRLSGELDDIDSRRLDNDPRSVSLRRRLRTLLSTLTHDRPPSKSELASLTEIVRTRALSDPTWLRALSAMERLHRDSTCSDCVDELTRALWQQLDDALPPPSAAPLPAHPLQHAYEQRLSNGESP